MTHNDFVAAEPGIVRMEELKASTLNMGFLSSSSGYALKRAYLRMHDDFLRSVADLGLRPQLFSVLCLIAENSGTTQSTLAGALSIERSNMVLLIGELVRRRLISRERVVTDRRMSALRVTAAGQRLYRTAADRLAAHEVRMLGGLSERERTTLMTLLARVRVDEPSGRESRKAGSSSGRRIYA